MKLFKKILLLILAILPAVYSAVAVLFLLPDTVAAHFGVDGQPDRYGSKYEAFLLPGIILATYLIYLLIRNLKQKSSADNTEQIERRLSVTDTVVMISLVLLNVLCVYVLMLMNDPALAKDSESLINTIIPAMVGILFIVLGNIMPKTKRNHFLGIRVKFAMDTDEHWYIANRAGGIAMVISGLVTVIAGLILRSFFYIIVMTIALLITNTVAILVSYVKIKGKQSNK